MDFDLPPEYRTMRETIREFCDEEIEPIAQEIEDETRFPREVFERLGELDIMGIPIPERWGGLGEDYLLYSLVAEELGRVSGSVGFSHVIHTSLGTQPIANYGTDRQKDRWLEPLATGERIGAWALTEPNGGSDMEYLETTARRDGDHYVLNGTKQFISNASEAGTILVKATTTPDAPAEGMSTFIVDPNDDGIEVTTVWDTMGLRSHPACEVQLDDCRIPASRLLGDEGDGRQQTHETLNGGHIAMAALAVGLAQGAYDAAREYASEREQFGRRISKFDAIRDDLVEMRRKIERARLLARKAALRYDENDPSATWLSSIAKLDAAETSREVAERAVQIHGGYGYTTEYPPQRYYRDAKLMEIAMGTNQIQRKIIGEELGF